MEECPTATALAIIKDDAQPSGGRVPSTETAFRRVYRRRTAAAAPGGDLGECERCGMPRPGTLRVLPPGHETPARVVPFLSVRASIRRPSGPPATATQFVRIDRKAREYLRTLRRGRPVNVRAAFPAEVRQSPELAYAALSAILQISGRPTPVTRIFRARRGHTAKDVHDPHRGDIRRARVIGSASVPAPPRSRCVPSPRGRLGGTRPRTSRPWRANVARFLGKRPSGRQRAATPMRVSTMVSTASSSTSWAPRRRARRQRSVPWLRIRRCPKCGSGVASPPAVSRRSNHERCNVSGT